MSVFNACTYNFKNLKLVGLETLSGLATACHLADIEIGVGAVRSTTIHDDLGELIEAYDAGKDVSGTAFAKSHSSLYSRLKRRTGNRGWLDVFLAAREVRSDLAFARFFVNMPAGVTMQEDGSVWKDGEQIA